MITHNQSKKQIGGVVENRLLDALLGENLRLSSAKLPRGREVERLERCQAPVDPVLARHQLDVIPALVEVNRDIDVTQGRSWRAPRCARDK